MVRGRGFTLIELMITVAVIAILAAVALPAYTDYVRRGKIAEATTTLLSMRTKMELYYQDNRKYTGACTAGTVAPLPSNVKYFDITCTPAPTDTAYTVVATGKGDMAGFTYTIDQANTRATTAVPDGWGTAPISCWVTRKGGTC